MVAAEYNCVSCAELLLSKGADIHFVNEVSINIINSRPNLIVIYSGWIDVSSRSSPTQQQGMSRSVNIARRTR